MMKFLVGFLLGWSVGFYPAYQWKKTQQFTKTVLVECSNTLHLCFDELKFYRGYK